MARRAWTDERLDDLAATLDTNVNLSREEIHGFREDTRQDFGELRDGLSAWQRQIAQIGWALAGALIAAIVALV
jgi:hypothetical protein